MPRSCKKKKKHTKNNPPSDATQTGALILSENVTALMASHLFSSLSHLELFEILPQHATAIYQRPIEI